MLPFHPLAYFVNRKESTSHNSELRLVELQRLLHFLADNKDLNMQEILWFQVTKFLHLMESLGFFICVAGWQGSSNRWLSMSSKISCSNIPCYSTILSLLFNSSMTGVVTASIVGEFFLFETSNLTTKMNSHRSHQLENSSWKPHLWKLNLHNWN